MAIEGEMEISIALPNAVPGTSGTELTEWARRAEARGFSSLGTIDRIAYDNYEPLVALAAAAAVTERIGLCTSVLLAPLRLNAAELAKEALSLNALCGGRFTLGVGLGGREGTPRLMGLAYFALGETAEADAESYLRDYYAWLGEDVATYIVGSAARDAETARRCVSEFAEAGCGELIFCPSSSDPDQVDLLADAVGL